MADALFDLFRPRATLLRNFIRPTAQRYGSLVKISVTSMAGEADRIQRRAPAREPERPAVFEGEAMLTPKAPARRSHVGSGGRPGTDGEGANAGWDDARV
jgi:hypothetical protein